MKIEVNDSFVVPEEIERVISSLIGNVPLEETGRVVEGFTWKWDKGSIFSWAKLLDKFDEYLTVCCTNLKSILSLKGLETDLTEPELVYPENEVYNVLLCTKTILSNNVGQENYGSKEQLSQLLACSSRRIVHLCLELVRIVHLRPSTGSTPSDLSERLSAIAAPPCGPSLLQIITHDVGIESNKDQFKFTIESDPDEVEDERTDEDKESPGRPRTVKYKTRLDLPSDDMLALQLVWSNNLPIYGVRQRFRLLSAIRASALYDASEEELEREATMRFLALATYTLLNDVDDMISRSPELTKRTGLNDLIPIVFEKDDISDSVMLAALQAFTSKFVGRDRITVRPDNVDRILLGGSMSLLGLYLNNCMKSMQAGSEMGGQLVEQLFILLAALAGSSYLAEDVFELGILGHLETLLRDNTEHGSKILSRALIALQVSIGSSTAVANTVVSSKAMECLGNRLRDEITECINRTTPFHYSKKMLLKRLLKLYTKCLIASETEGVQEELAAILYTCLGNIFKNPRLAESAIFESAASCFRQLLHYDPRQFNAMLEAGLVNSYIDAIQGKTLCSNAVFCGIPNTISAICLNDKGKSIVKESKVLYVLGDLLVDKQSVFEMRDTTSIGATLEEMCRHHETMVEHIVHSLVAAVEIVAHVANNGNDEVDPAEVVDDKEFQMFLSRSIMNLLNILSGLSQNKNAVREFIRLEGMQLLLKLMHPDMAIDTFCCSLAAASLSAYVRGLVKYSDKTKDLFAILLQESKRQLVKLIKSLEFIKTAGSESLLVLKGTEKHGKTACDIVRQLSHCDVLLSCVAFGRGFDPSLFLEANLCLIPTIEATLSPVLHQIALLEDWRIQMDNLLLERKDGNEKELLDLKEESKQGELIRDVVNQYFKSTCVLFDNLAQVSQETTAWTHHDDAAESRKTIGILATSAILQSLKGMWKSWETESQSLGDVAIGRRARTLIRISRLVMASSSDIRGNIVHYDTMNALVEYSAFALLLKELEWCESTIFSRPGVSVPTKKAMELQRDLLENTGIGRANPEANVNLAVSVELSLNHAALALLGVVERLTTMKYYKGNLTFRQGHLLPGMIPPWRELADVRRSPFSRAIGQAKAMINHLFIQHSGNLANYPLHLSKIAKILVSCSSKAIRSPSNLLFSSFRIQPEIEQELVSHGFQTNEVWQALFETGNEKEKALVLLKDNCLKADRRRDVITSCPAYAESAELPNLPYQYLRSFEIEHFVFDFMRPLYDRCKAAEEELGQDEDLTIEVVFNRACVMAGCSRSSVFDAAEMLVDLYSDDDSHVETLKQLFIKEIDDLIDSLKSSKSANISEGNNVCQLLAISLNLSPKLRAASKNMKGDVKGAQLCISHKLVEMIRIWRNRAAKLAKRSKQVIEVPTFVDSVFISLASIYETCFFQPRADGKEKGENQDFREISEPIDVVQKVCRDLIPEIGTAIKQEMATAADVAVDALEWSIGRVSAGWNPPQEEKTKDDILPQSCPRSTTGASLEILKTVSKCRRAADVIISKKGHNLVLQIPQELTQSDQDMFLKMILKHLVEDENNLQQSMEAAIRSGMMRKRSAGWITQSQSRQSRSMAFKPFFTQFSHLACRDPEIFFRAIKSCCSFSGQGRKLEVNLKAATENQSAKPEESHDGQVKTPIATPNQESSGTKPIENLPTTSKKANKKIPHHVTTVVDAILGRLIELASLKYNPPQQQEQAESATNTDVVMSNDEVKDGKMKERPENTRKRFCVFVWTQQLLCVGILSDFLASFSQCVTAFLRRDSDPISLWLLKDEAISPLVKSGKKEKASSARKKAKELKDKDRPYVKSPIAKEGSNIGYLIKFLISNLIACEKYPVLPLRRILSKHSCTLLDTLYHRSVEGQKRVIQQLHLILRSWTYPGHTKPTEIRKLENKCRTQISKHLEGALTLLAMIVLERGKSQDSSQKNHVVESLIDTGGISMLTDIFCHIDLNDVLDERTKAVSTAAVRILEKLTSVRTITKADGAGPSSPHVEDLISRLMEIHRFAHDPIATEGEGDASQEDSDMMDLDDESEGSELDDDDDDDSEGFSSDDYGYSSAEYESSMQDDEGASWEMNSSSEESEDGVAVADVVDITDSSEDSMDDQDLMIGEEEIEEEDQDDEDGVELEDEDELDDLNEDIPDEYTFEDFMEGNVDPDLPFFLMEPNREYRYDQSLIGSRRLDIDPNLFENTEEPYYETEDDDNEEYYDDEDVEEYLAYDLGDDERLVSDHVRVRGTRTSRRYWLQDDENSSSEHRGRDFYFGYDTAFDHDLSRLSAFGRDSRIRGSQFNHPLITRAAQGISGPRNNPQWSFLNEPRSSHAWQTTMRNRSLTAMMRRPFSSLLDDRSMHFPPPLAERLTNALEEALNTHRDQSTFGTDDANTRMAVDPIFMTERNDFSGISESRRMGHQEYAFEYQRAISPSIIRPRQRQRRDDLQTQQITVQENMNDGDPPQTETERETGPEEGDIPTNPDQNNRDEDDIEPIDPEFLAALPPELQQEVLENHERERQSRRLARQVAAARPGRLMSDSYLAEIVTNIPDHLQEEALLSMDMFGQAGERPDNAQADGELRIEENLNDSNIPDDGPVDDLDAVPFGRIMQAVGRRLNGGRSSGELPIRLDSRNRHGRPAPRRARPGHETGGLERWVLNVDGEWAQIGGEGDDPRSSRDSPSDMVPLLEESQIPQLLRLFRFSKWDGRLHLNRTLRNLTESKKLGHSIFQQVFGLLRCPLSPLEYNMEELEQVLMKLKHPTISSVLSVHNTVIEKKGAKQVVVALGLENTEGDDDEDLLGIQSPSVTRRLLELLRHSFGLVKRGIDTVIEVEVPPIYQVYARMGLLPDDAMEVNGATTIAALEVLLSLPLRHDIAKSTSLRSMSLELVCKFMSHFEKLEAEIADMEDKIRDKSVDSADGKEKEEAELKELLEKAEIHRKAFAKVSSNIIKCYLSMLTYPSIKESEIDSIKIILQGLCMINDMHWSTLVNAVYDFVLTTASQAGKELEQISKSSLHDPTVVNQDSKAKAIYRCLHSLAEGVFQLVLDRFNPKLLQMPDSAKRARSTVCSVMQRMIDETHESLWEPFYKAASAIENLLDKQTTSAISKTMPPLLIAIKPYIEGFFMLHDMMHCVSCSIEVLAQEMKDLAEEEAAWSNTKQDVSRAAQQQTARFTRIRSLERVESPLLEESPASPQRNMQESQTTHEKEYCSFAEHHRRLVNAIITNDPSVLEESMNVLRKFPKILDFENKRMYFKKRVQALSRYNGYVTRLNLNVRRAHVFEDSFNQLRSVSKSQLRSPLRVTFAGEEGVDAGGVTREWYQVMSREMFNPAISLFEAVPQGSSTYQPNPNSVVQTDEGRGISHLDYFKFVGHVVGKALLDDQIIDAHFTRSFYKHMLGMPLTYKDIEAVDPDFYKNLRWILENDIDGVIELSFSEESDFFGQRSLIELCPNGASIKVTDTNKRDYVDAVTRHRMTNAIRPQIDSFLQGFWNVVPRISLELFNDHELELMISGLPDVDIADLRANCEYHGGYSATTPVIMWFWDVVSAMEREDRALLLQFVTGTSKVPVGGFGELQALSGRQKFQIHKAFGDKDRLPTAHTCFNQLDLPEYVSKEQLKERLLMAIHEGKEGFGFA